MNNKKLNEVTKLKIAILFSELVELSIKHRNDTKHLFGEYLSIWNNLGMF